MVGCSFIIGYQYNHTFYYQEIGYDPEWSRFSVGTVLLMLVLEDLFNISRPEIIDFGAGDHEYKEYFSTDRFVETHVFLLRRRPSQLLASALHRACYVSSRKTATLLNQLGMKTRVKRLIRRVLSR